MALGKTQWQGLSVVILIIGFAFLLPGLILLGKRETASGGIALTVIGAIVFMVGLGLLGYSTGLFKQH